MKAGGAGDESGLFRATFHDSPIGIAILDEVGRYVEVNAAFAAILHLEPADIVSKSFAQFTHPADLPRDVELLSQLARNDFPYYQVQKRYITADDTVVWVRITVTRIDDSVRTESHHFIAQVEDVTEVRRAKELLERKAFYDSLTGLANRSLLMERIDAALAKHADRETTAALLFLDIDDFKLVNDSLGHDAGDHLVAIVAQRLQGATRRGDTVARLGGDEFVVVFEQVDSVGDAEAHAAVAVRAAQAALTISDRELRPSMSGGLALAEPGMTASDLLRAADAAMYEAKHGGRGRVVVYDDALRHASIEKLEIEADLRHALREGELRVVYQPIIELETEAPFGYEALVRWEHPRRGTLLPGEFMAVAEDAGLVVPIGSFVAHEACAFVRRHPDFAGPVFVNVSPRQLGAGRFAHVLDSATRTARVDPERLCVELVEIAVDRRTPLMEEDLDDIGRLGVRILLDDFGAGGASLARLLDRPVAGIKLADVFARRLEDSGMASVLSRGIAQTVSALGVLGIIKGVESERQREIAIGHGWKLGQGFFLGQPDVDPAPAPVASSPAP